MGDVVRERGREGRRKEGKSESKSQQLGEGSIHKSLRYNLA